MESFAVLLAVFAVITVAGLLKYFPPLIFKIRLTRALSKLPADPRQHWMLKDGKYMLDPVDSNLMPECDEILMPLAKKGCKVASLGTMKFFEGCHLIHPSSIAVGVSSDPKFKALYSCLDTWLGDGLLTSNGAKWSRHRKLLTNAFHFDILKSYVKVFTQCSLVFMNELAKKGESVDIVPHVKLLSLDALLRCICGQETNCQVSGTHVPYVESVNKLQYLTIQRLLSLPAKFEFIWPLMPLKWKYDKHSDIVHKYAMDIIKKRRAHIEQNRDATVFEAGKHSKKQYINFIDILLAARDENGKGLTDLEIREEVDTFMFEGHDTTANALNWTLYLLAQHPEHQAKCREEVEKIFSEKDEIEWDDLKELVYLQYCIKESMRLYPPVPIAGRELAESKVIDGVRMPERTPILLDIYVIHRNPHVWNNPETFDPLRFTPESSKDRDPLAYIPFSAGPRNCIGQNFAMAEMKIVLANLLHTFELSLDENYKTEKKRYILLHPNHVWIKLKKIS